MKKCFLLLSGLFTVVSLSQAQTIAQWTFEGAPVPSTTAASYTYGAPEIGSGSASGVHAAGNTVWSSPAGDGSSHSFSVNTWAVGDYWQFQTSTLGFTGIQLDWDQTSSGTGPGRSDLEWSTDGTTFTQFGAQYTILANGGAPNASWSSTTYSAAYHFTVDLSSITALDNAPSVWFRLVDDSTISANGGTVGTGGTDRVDNFAVSVPEPGSLALLGLGLAGLMAWRRQG